MSTAQIYLIADNASNANFRLWGKGISDQLQTAGWTKTTDTGQVDWTTVAVPSSTYVYEIRQPASDALQTGSTAYYLKIEYGFSSTVVRIRLSLGTATNGAGTLSGYVTSTNAINSSGSFTATGSTTFECDFSWDTSRMGVLLWRNHTDATNAPCFFGIERTKNTDGTDSSVGVTLVAAGNGTRSNQTIHFTAGVAPQYSRLVILGGLFPSAVAGGTTAFNNQVTISPVFPAFGKFGNPMTAVGVMTVTDAIEGALFTATIYGSSRTFMMSKSAAFTSISDFLGSSEALFFRYD